MRFADAYSSSSTNIPAGIQITTNNDAGYTNANGLGITASDTLNDIYSFSGAASNGQAIQIATGGNGASISTPNLYLDTASNQYRVGIGTNAPTAQLTVSNGSGINPTALITGTTSYADLALNQLGSGDIFTASASGNTKFTITNTGNIVLARQSSPFSTINSAATTTTDLYSSISWWHTLYPEFVVFMGAFRVGRDRVLSAVGQYPRRRNFALQHRPFRQPAACALCSNLSQAGDERPRLRRRADHRVLREVLAERLVANEMAPRVHNSGHWTIEGCVDQPIREPLCARFDDLPLGSTRPLGHTAMINFLGQMPDRDRLLAIEGLALHDYGKEPRPGRKLGHCTILKKRITERNSALADALRSIQWT